MLDVCLVVVFMFAALAFSIFLLVVALWMVGVDDVLPGWDDDGLTKDGKGR